jgi:hypothetical protein
MYLFFSHLEHLSPIVRASIAFVTGTLTAVLVAAAMPTSFAPLTEFLIGLCAAAFASLLVYLVSKYGGEHRHKGL